MRKPENSDAAPDGALRSIAALRARTSAAHVEAERSGIIFDLLKGRASRGGFALLLRNLAAVYAALERELERHAATPAVGEICRPEIARCAALDHDLSRLAGPGWRDLPLAPATARYVERIETAGRDNASLLIAHAYVRYLGDLSGGQILKRLIMESFALGPDDLHFYDFDSIGNLPDFKQRYRDSFDCAMRVIVDPEAVLDEAVAAFECNITLSNEVRSLAAHPPSAG